MANTTVNVKCPYCGHVGDEFTVLYTPMAALTNHSPYRNEDGAEMEPAGNVECEACGEKFLYRMIPAVKVETAKRPDYA